MHWRDPDILAPDLTPSPQGGTRWMQPAWTFIAASALLLTSMVSYSSAASCESLAGLTLENATVTLAQPVAPGAFTLPPEAAGRGGVGVAGDFSRLPAFCRVA